MEGVDKSWRNRVREFASVGYLHMWRGLSLLPQKGVDVTLSVSLKKGR